MRIVRDTHCYEHATTDAILLPWLLAAPHGPYCGWAVTQPADPEGNFRPPRILYQKWLLSALFDDAVSCQDCMASV
jgi:hypothetical protein